MNHKKNFATALAVLMAVQNSSQPWAVLAYDQTDSDGNEPVVSDVTLADTAAHAEVSADPFIEEGNENTPDLLEDPTVSAPDQDVLPAFADLSAEGEISVASVTETGATVERSSLPLGDITEQSTSVDGFDFVGASVNGTAITSVKRWDKTGEFYYLPADSETPARLEPGQTIVLTYREKAAQEAEEAPAEDVNAPAASSKEPAANKAEEPVKEEVSVLFYLFTQGTSVPTFTEVKVAKGEQTTVKVPEKTGYTAYLADENGNITNDEEPITSITDTFDEDTEINICYVPGQAKYTVIHQFGDRQEIEECDGSIGMLTEAEPKTVQGWYPLYFSNSVVNANGTTVVNIEYAKNVYQLKFDSQGGSFVIPVEMDIESTVSLDSYKPTREGYTFAGWELNGNAVDKITGNDIQAGDNSITVTAKWNPATVTYTVQYWKQNVEGTGYEYVAKDTVTRTALTGSSVRGDNNKNTSSKTSDYYGFKYSPDNSPEETVAADGSTVVNVRYDRVNCTVKYQISKNGEWVALDDKTSTGLYGAPYNGWFNTYDNVKYKWYQQKNSNSTCVLLNTYDFETAGYTRYTVDPVTGDWTLTFYGKKANSLGAIVYYNEAWDGTFQRAEVTGSSSADTLIVHQKFNGYDLYKYVTSNRALDESQMTSASYWQGKRNVAEGSEIYNDHKYIASTLKKYTIEFKSNGQVVKTIPNVKYTTPIAVLDDYKDLPTPEAPKPYLEFAGWYLDPVFENKVDETTTMPNSDLILYAKWVAKDVNVTVHYNNDKTPDQTTSVQGGTSFGAMTQPEDKEDCTFAGWYIDEACTKPYSENMLIEQDTDIYAKWKKNDVVTVHVQYVEDLEDGTTVPLAEESLVKARPNTQITLQGQPFDGLRVKEEFINYSVKDENNTVTFHYERICDRYYKVVYKDVDTQLPVAEEVPVNVKQRPSLIVRANMASVTPNYELVGDSYQPVDSKDLSKDAEEPTEIVFWVQKKQLTLTAESLDYIYDGQSHILPAASASEADATIYYSTDNGQTWSEELPQATDVEDSKDVKVKAVKDGYKDSEVLDVHLAITKRAVTLTSASDSKVYDGNWLTNGEVTVSGDGFAEGEGAAYDVTGSILLPGSVDNEFTYTLNENTKSGNYEITQTAGTLTVTDVADEDKEEVKVTAASGEYLYDGTEKTVSGVSGTEFTWNDHAYTVEGLEASAAGTDAGEYTNEVTGTAVVKDEYGNDVTSQFKVTTVNGTLVINKRAVTLTSATDSKVYDGSWLTNSEITVSGDGFAEGEGAAYEVTGSILLPGSVDNEFTYTLNENTKSGNYEITQTAGTLTVTDVADEDKEEVKVTAASGEYLYDGTEKTVSGVSGTEFTWNDHAYTVEGLDASVAGTDAGEYTNEVTGTAVVKDEYGNDVTSQFKVTTVNGTLVINKRAVTLTSATDSKVYDGTPLINTHVEVTGDGFVKGEEPEYVFTEGSRPTEVGEYDNAFDAEVSKNYVVTKEYGKLTIEKAEPKIEITIDNSLIDANGFKRLYDGTTSTITAVAKNQNGDVIDGRFTYTIDGESSDKAPEFTNAGTWTVTVTTSNPNCNETSVDVSVEIMKRKVHLVSADAEKIYDGDPVTGHDQVTDSGDGFIDGEKPVFHSFGTYIDAGEYENTFSLKFNKRSNSALSRLARLLNPTDDPDHIADNYEITHEFGTVVIKKADANNHNLTLEDKTVTYDGKEQMLDAATSDIEDAVIEYSVDGETWTDEMPAFKDAGEYTVYARAVHKNYEDAETSAVLKVLPAELVVETESATKEYDGKPLTAGGKLTGVVEGEVIVLKTTGSQTEAGKSVNTYELDFGQAKASNYEITEKLGELEVTEAKKVEEPKEEPKVPTGVASNIGLWGTLMAASGAAMVGNMKLSRKERNKNKYPKK